MPSVDFGGASGAFAAYEAVRHRLPGAVFPENATPVGNLGDIADRFDVFLLDAFGVLNVGETAIPGSQDRVRDLQMAGKTVMVVSNAAGFPKRMLLEKYARLGFDFSPENVLTSREVLLDALSRRPAAKRGLMVSKAFGKEEIGHLDVVFLGEDIDAYDGVDEFLLIGSAEWTETRQKMLETSLCKNPRPVLVGNPDIVAPRESGLSTEPGFYAHRLADATGVEPEFFGKPFANIFEMALEMLPPDTDLNRVVMVGDTLQTDILGGCAAGVKTALISDFGSLKGIDADDAAQRSGIIPDFVMPGR